MEDNELVLFELLRYISLGQLEDGSFLSYSSPTQKPFKKEKNYRTVFATTLILSCLNSIKDTAEVSRIRQKASEFILSQKNNNCTFNYWTRDSKEYSSLPYPNDLDDTFCALSALYLHDSNSFNGKMLAQITSILTGQEAEEGGPYRTWVTGEDTDPLWSDIDLAVNSNIAYFLSLLGIELPKLTAFTEKAILKNNYASRYYPSPYPIVYFISRWYRGVHKQKLISFILKSLKNSHINPLDQILCLTSLMNLDHTIKKLPLAISTYIKPYPFCFDPAQAGKRYYAGSNALTAAFYAETITKFLNSQPKKSTANSSIDNSRERIYLSVTKQYRARFSTFNQQTQEQAENILQKIFAADANKQIVLLPYFTAKCINNKQEIPEDFLSKLGLANLYGWIAYTIYDDIMDEEGKTNLLPIANMCLRELTDIFSSILPETSGFYSYFKRTMDRIDNSNLWELSQCRNFQLPNYGDYSVLAEKSLGHILGPVTILYYLNLNEKTLEFRQFINLMKHYIIARQLNDDAHDWENDFKKGYINPVATIIMGNKAKRYSEKELKSLREDFWSNKVVYVCNIILRHTRLARKYLMINTLISNPAYFEALISSIEKSVDTTLSEHKKAQDFLKEY